MSVKPSLTPTIHARKGPYYLSSFEKCMGPVVTTWVREELELFWLAPKTPPPLTADKVLAWPGPQGCPMLFGWDGLDAPVGYLELNPMPGEERHLWVGHCIIRPDQRRLGLGRKMIDLMLDQAFLHRQAKQVSLVVFPDNYPAIRCYQAVGFTIAGEQIKYFQTSGRQHNMLRMSIDRDRYAFIRHQDRGQKPTPAPGRKIRPHIRDSRAIFREANL